MFAPTDDAFAKLPSESVKTLLQEENREDLIRVLKRHVLPGPPTYFRRGLAWDTHSTLNGDEEIATQVFKNNNIKVVTDQGTKATIEPEEILASNGVIHVIDTVLLK